MKVGIVQMDICWEDRERNRERIATMIDRDCPEDIDWVILPEMCLSGFTMNAAAAALTDADIRFFKEISLSREIAVTFGGIRDRRNQSITLRDGVEACAYSKIHLFSYAEENKTYEYGKDVLTFRQKDFNITPFICYDLRFSDCFFRAASLTGVFAVIANWPGKRQDHWNTLLRARAIENQAYVIGVNRVGTDPNEEYFGGSVIVNPDGSILLDCARQEGVFCADMDVARVARSRAGFPALKDRKQWNFKGI